MGINYHRLNKDQREKESIKKEKKTLINRIKELFNGN